MKIRIALFSCLFVLSACSSSDDGDTDVFGGAGLGGNANGGNANGGNANGGDANGGSANGGNGNATNGGSGNGGSGDGGAGNASSGGDGGDGGSGGDGNAPISCGMPVPNATPGNTCYNAPPPALKLTEILPPGEIFAPLQLVSPPGDPDRLFVIVREGLIRIIKDGVLLPTPFLDIIEETTNNNGENEHGLLGMAFDPNFASNKKVWIHYNQPTGDYDSTIASVVVSDDNPDVANAGSLDTLFSFQQPFDNHKGGMLAFGPDGCLYASFGDGGAGGDPGGRGQTTTEPFASILRIDVDNYPTMAPGNPGFMDDRVWSYGLRNPWRFSIDRATGDLYIADVGQNAWEEVDVEPAGTGNFNYGWKVMEGTHSFDGPLDTTGKRMPVIEYGRGEGQSITGGYVYRGSAIPDLVGRYLYADFRSHNFWSLTYSGEEGGQPQACDQYELTEDLAKPQSAGGVTSFGEDANGELYVLTLNGGVYRIDAE